jgi:hypothetical protein
VVLEKFVCFGIADSRGEPPLWRPCPCRGETEDNAPPRSGFLSQLGGRSDRMIQDFSHTLYHLMRPIF